MLGLVPFFSAKVIGRLDLRKRKHRRDALASLPTHNGLILGAKNIPQIF
jgi:hypothetical protein